jgi:hypothetical protein
MWIFSETGFVSVVAHRDDDDTFLVRSRDRKSLETLSKVSKAGIIETVDSDYPFRVYISRDSFAKWSADQIKKLDYPNYKGRMYTARPEFGNALHDVWEDMHQVSPNYA